MINKLGYLCQAADPSITVPEMKRFERKVKKGIVSIIGRRMNWKQVLQSQLPVKDGGMGFRSFAAAASLLYHVTQVKIAQAYLSDYPALVPQQIFEPGGTCRSTDVEVVLRVAEGEGVGVFAGTDVTGRRAQVVFGNVTRIG